MSQIATTIEQSKRLLAAGIDPASADMMWVIPESFDSDWDDKETQEPSLKLQRYGRYCDTPAWSLSRLCDLAKDKKTIVLMCSLNPQFDSVDDYIEDLVRLLELPDCEITPGLHER